MSGFTTKTFGGLSLSFSSPGAPWITGSNLRALRSECLGFSVHLLFGWVSNSALVIPEKQEPPMVHLQLPWHGLVSGLGRKKTSIQSTKFNGKPGKPINHFAYTTH